MKKVFFPIFVVTFSLALVSCVAVYTEKRSQTLSRAVSATADSIKVARFDLASEYSEQAVRLAYPPKEKIKINPVVTTNTKNIEIKNGKTDVTVNGSRRTISSSSIKVSSHNGKDDQLILRLVVPEYLKHAKLLVENSEEWNELIKNNAFAKQLEIDNLNLKKLADEISAQLAKEREINDKMIQELNELQKEVLKKNLHIIKLYIIIAFLVLALGGGVYLRIKGIL